MSSGQLLATDGRVLRDEAKAARGIARKLLIEWLEILIQAVPLEPDEFDLFRLHDYLKIVRDVAIKYPTVGKIENGDGKIIHRFTLQNSARINEALIQSALFEWLERRDNRRLQ